MRTKLNYILITALILITNSCQNEKKIDNANLQRESEIKTDSNSGYNEINDAKITVKSDDNSDELERKSIERPEKTTFQNLTVDTSKIFGIWTLDPKGPHADFHLTSESYYVADYDGDGAMLYNLNKNEITIFYSDFIRKGVITSGENDTLKIKWSDSENENKYVKFEN